MLATVLSMVSGATYPYDLDNDVARGCWICTFCANSRDERVVTNKSGDRFCRVCGLQRVTDGFLNDPRDLPMEMMNPLADDSVYNWYGFRGEHQTAQPPARSPHEPNTWACERCTFLNGGVRTRCEMCSHPKPSQARPPAPSVRARSSYSRNRRRSVPSPSYEGVRSQSQGSRRSPSSGSYVH